MNKYFFAECCLQVEDPCDFLHGSRLDNFIRELSYLSKINLEVIPGTFDAHEDIINISNGLGISINNIGDTKWLFSSTDKVNPCSIKATDQYSNLHGYITSCGDLSILSENFLQLLRVAIECNLVFNSSISLHASCIAFNGKSILFTAPSGTGKSTQADIWEKHIGARIINGDRPSLHFSPGEVRAHGVPWDGKEQIFLQEDYPVRAIVEVRRAKSNRLRKLSEAQAFKLMMKQCLIPMWDDAAKFLAAATISKITKSVPFYRLFCLPEESAADLLKEVLFSGGNFYAKEVQADMKLKEGFVLKNVVDEWIAMPVGKNIKYFEGAIVLNDVSAFIWKQLESPISKEDLLQAILEEYDIDEQTAVRDMNDFLARLENLKLLSSNGE